MRSFSRTALSLSVSVCSALRCWCLSVDCDCHELSDRDYRDTAWFEVWLKATATNRIAQCMYVRNVHKLQTRPEHQHMICILSISMCCQVFRCKLVRHEESLQHTNDNRELDNNCRTIKVQYTPLAYPVTKVTKPKRDNYYDIKTTATRL